MHHKCSVHIHPCLCNSSFISWDGLNCSFHFFYDDDGKRIACHNLSRATTGACSLTRTTLRGADPAQPHGQGACDRPPHVRRGGSTGKLQRPVQLHKRGLRTNEDATPIPCAASSEAAPTWCGPRQATARMSWLPVTNGLPPPEPEPPGAPCYLAARVQGMLFLSSCEPVLSATPSLSAAPLCGWPSP